MKSLDWFKKNIGQYVLRNDRQFFIKDEQVAEYAFELQDKGFTYGEF